jgi:NAD(P)-dependent dehydrogenase (short-subunit alcohol dehydrogenase family)
MTSYVDDLFSLAGRVAVVTGGSSGIGRGIALALGRAGGRIVIVARDPANLADTVGELTAAGCTATSVSADLSDRARVARAAVEAQQPFGPPDILVNCAGVNIRPPLGELTPGQWDELMAVNLTAPFLLGQHYGPQMASRGWGRIINITSQQADRAFANSGGYGVTKGGLASLTRSQSEAWATRGVCANALCPGFVPTALNTRLSADPAVVAALAARTMVGRNGLAEDFAGPAVFLASPASVYVTGQVIRVDGGFSVT